MPPKPVKMGVPGVPFKNILAVAENLYKEYNLFKSDIEKEKTKRARIKAEAKIRVTEILAMRDVVMEYLKRSFDERAELFEELFRRLDIAVDKHDLEVISVTLTAMVNLARQSPLDVAVDRSAFRKALSDKNREWRL